MVSAQALTEDEVIAELQGEGFMVVDTGTTLLGRIRITALGPEGTREVVLNPRNGKVLRDTIIEEAPDTGPETVTTAKVEPVSTQALDPVEPANAAVETLPHNAAAETAAAVSDAAIDVVQDMTVERAAE